jgi:hypothetical protein
VLCSAIILTFTFIPALATILHIQAIGTSGWFIIACMSLIPFVVGQIQKLVFHRFSL